MSADEQQSLQKLSETLPFPYPVVVDVFDVLKDFDKTKTLLEYSCRQAISPYVFLNVILIGQREEQAKEFKRTGDLWLKWSSRKMILSGHVQTTKGAFWKLFQAWKRFKKAIRRIFRRFELKD